MRKDSYRLLVEYQLEQHELQLEREALLKKEEERAAWDVFAAFYAGEAPPETV